MTERASQVKYSRGKAMADFALSRLQHLPVTVACLGLLYCKTDGLVGQDGKKGLNLIDLSLLPLTPILGDGTAPLQPQEVSDASDRLAFLALTDPSRRPVQQSALAAAPYGTPSKRAATGLSPPPPTPPSSRNAATAAESAPHIDDQYAPPKNGVISPHFRRYDAVGPETMTMTSLLERFARYQGENRSGRSISGTTTWSSF